MSANSNVVQLDQTCHANQRVSKDLALLHHCRDRLIAALERALPAMMGQVDDALFDLADKAKSNRDQTMYFEAMRHIRVKRSDIESKFRRELAEIVNRKIQRRHSFAPDAGPTGNAKLKLVLVEEDDLEVSCAVTNMVSKIRNTCRGALFELERRVSLLLDDPDIGSDDNPLGPESICDAFRKTSDEIESSIEVRLVVFKLFAHHVVGEVEQIYADINQLLILNGVLPEVRAEVPSAPGGARSGPRPSRAGTARASTTESGAIDESDTSDSPLGDCSGQELLEILRRAMMLNNVAGEKPVEVTRQQHRVVSGLTQLQRGDVGAFSAAGLSVDPSQLANGTANVLRDLKTGCIAAGLDDTDQLMIDVVAMMFDYILDDANIPDKMKALIGRLQIPVLKVAILDKSLFARKTHPAKQLLNRLSEAALGWSGRLDSDEAFFQKIESFVLRVMDDFDDCVEIFQTVLDDLNAFLRQEQSGAQANAWRNAKVAQGRERLAAAKVRARQEVQARLEDEDVSAIVADFLDDLWRELLVVRYINGGEDSEGWQLALQTADDLVWSALPKAAQEDRRRLLRLLPGLIERLKAGMAELSVADDERKAFLAGLARLHLRAVRSEADDPVKKDSDRDRAAQPGQVPAAVLGTGAHPPGKTEAEPNGEEMDELRLAIERANDAVHETANSRLQCEGMGTTVVVARFSHDGITFGHVGDSRLYRLRSECFEQLTTDHSLRQALIDSQHFTPEEATHKAGKNVLTRAVGIEPRVRADIQQINTLPGDLFLLCSDGLTEMVDDERIQSTLESAGDDLETATTLLIDAANDAGGRDNISVALVKVIESIPDSDVGLRGLAGKLAMWGGSDVGRLRAHNEDSLAYDVDEGLVVLADGMGGCSSGEVASTMAVDAIVASLRSAQAADAAGESAGNAPVDTSLGVLPDNGARYAAVNAMFWEDGWDDVETADAGASPDASDDMATQLEELSALIADGTENVEVEEITLQGEAARPETDEVGAHYIAAVEGLKVGTWVEFRHEDGEVRRGRLTWVSSATGRYLFTDRRGDKVADATLHGLAVELRRGTASIIDDVPLFDRAISHLTASLRAA